MAPAENSPRPLRFFLPALAHTQRTRDRRGPGAAKWRARASDCTTASCCTPACTLGCTSMAAQIYQYQEHSNNNGIKYIPGHKQYLQGEQSVPLVQQFYIPSKSKFRSLSYRVD